MYQRLFILTFVLLLGALGCTAPKPVEDTATDAGRLPTIYPDYTDITIPPNIAPLNFLIDETCKASFARISAPTGDALEISGVDRKIKIPRKPWQKLLNENQGETLTIEVFIQEEAGGWTQFSPISNHIAKDEIDSYLAYRYMPPWYITYREMGIYQRNLESFEEDLILENTDPTNKGGSVCINCHTFANGDPNVMTIHTRFPFVMLLARDDEIKLINTRTEFNKAPFAYAAWHPNGTMAMYSVNKISQIFHTTGETRDVFDATSDLLLYDFDENIVSTDITVSHSEQLETFPAWSPDGKYLYFCSTPSMEDKDFDQYKKIKYDLMRIAFDAETKTWGELETMLSMKEVGLSVAMPKISPDGRFALICMCEYGTFPIFQESSDLYMLDLETGEHFPLACNSDKSESWHGWSRNSRWIVFSSKRDIELLARPHFAYIDANGKSSKAFVMPQEDPTAFKSDMGTYSVPEFITGKVTASRREMARLLKESEAYVEQAALDAEVLTNRVMETEEYASAYTAD